jgi:hypothetical protein
MVSLTQLSIIGILGSVLIVVMIGFLVSLGNDNGVTVETLYLTAFENNQDLVQNITYDISEAERGSTIDPSATDVAQLRGSITAEKEKLNFISSK